MFDRTVIHDAVVAVVPEAIGVSIGDLTGRSTWKVQLAEGASQAAIDAAQAKVQAIIDAFSPTDPQKRIFHVLNYERKRLYARQVACLLLGTREKATPDRVIEAGDDAAAPDPCDPNTPEPLSPYGLLGWPIGGVCDSDMTLIDELQKVYGIRCVQSKRTRDEKHGAIELLNGDLVDGRFKVMAGSPLEAQMLSLQWMTDEFGQLKEPKGKPDHSTDCAVYGRKLIAHLFESGAVGDPKPQPKPVAARGGRVDAGPVAAPAQPEWMSALADPPDQEDSSW